VSDDSNDAGVDIATANSKHGLSDAELDAIDHDTSQHDAPNDERLEIASQLILFSRQLPSHRDGSEGLHVTDGLEGQGDYRNREAAVGEVGGSDDAGAGAAGATTAAAIRQPGSVDSPSA